MPLEGTFAATCATIVSGAIAERCHFNGYIIFSTVMTGLLYPIPAHWCWAEGGWLRELGFRDFAGSSVVHMSGGICALVGESGTVGGNVVERNEDNRFYLQCFEIFWKSQKILAGDK